MKPHRLQLTHHLIMGYGLHEHMECYVSHKAHRGEMLAFHSEDYIQFLQKISPDNIRQNVKNIEQFFGKDSSDCPIFEGLFEFNQYTTGASLDAAVQLCQGQADVTINWSGGFHHAKKAGASGFCYINGTGMGCCGLWTCVCLCGLKEHFKFSHLALFSFIRSLQCCIRRNYSTIFIHQIQQPDIVLAICEMLKVYTRVLYIDIDVHHGDGVEEAFYTTDRVMTFSLHKYGDGFFPQTGAIVDKGMGNGEGFSVNVPLNNGITDDEYFEDLFRPILDKILSVFQPGAIFLQCGADSLAADRLGTLNLTTRGHARMVDYVNSKHIPTLVAGGGGYTIRNVARVWCYETAVLVNQHDISNDIPFNNYFEYFAPTYDLHLLPEKMTNLNKKADIDATRSNILRQLQDLEGAPSIAMQYAPPLFVRADGVNDEDYDDDTDTGDPYQNGDARNRNESGPSQKIQKRKKIKKRHASELYDGVD